MTDVYELGALYGASGIGYLGVVLGLARKLNDDDYKDGILRGRSFPKIAYWHNIGISLLWPIWMPFLFLIHCSWYLCTGIEGFLGSALMNPARHRDTLVTARNAEQRRRIEKLKEEAQVIDSAPVTAAVAILEGCADLSCESDASGISDSPSASGIRATDVKKAAIRVGNKLGVISRRMTDMEKTIAMAEMLTRSERRMKEYDELVEDRRELIALIRELIARVERMRG